MTKRALSLIFCASVLVPGSAFAQFAQDAPPSSAGTSTPSTSSTSSSSSPASPSTQAQDVSSGAASPTSPAPSTGRAPAPNGTPRDAAPSTAEHGAAASSSSAAADRHTGSTWELSGGAGIETRTPSAPARSEEASPQGEGGKSGRAANQYFRVGAGLRVASIGDSGFDAFADDDALAQFSLEGSYALYARGKLAFAVGAAWDVGSRSSGARGLATHLTVHRLTVPLEARYYLAPWLNVFAKVAPGASAYVVRVEDRSSSATLDHDPWTFAADASAGAAVRVVGKNSDPVSRPRIWISQELGYGLTANRSVRPGPSRDEDDVLGADERMRLGALAVNGVFWRAGVALTF